MEEHTLEEITDSILFHVEDVAFELTQTTSLTAWIQAVIESHAHQLRQLNYIFCSDTYLHKINIEYLNHDTYTDIITFPYQHSPIVESDIFISLDRVRENAQKFEVPFDMELRRVIIHGVLHLCGLADKTEAEKKQMRAMENTCLVLFDTEFA